MQRYFDFIRILSIIHKCSQNLILVTACTGLNISRLSEVLSNSSAIFIKNLGFGNTLTPRNSTAIQIAKFVSLRSKVKHRTNRFDVLGDLSPDLLDIDVI